MMEDVHYWILKTSQDEEEAKVLVLVDLFYLCIYVPIPFVFW